jgi:uncharacterized protein (DUF952 family)
MIYHFCPAASWAAAREAGVYTADTLATEGFIHLSRAEQVPVPANALARGRLDLVLLAVDEARLPPALRYEDGGDGTLYPHLYAPLPLDAVVAVYDFPPGPDGTFQFPQTTGQFPQTTGDFTRAAPDAPTGDGGVAG